MSSERQSWQWFLLLPCPSLLHPRELLQRALTLWKPCTLWQGRITWATWIDGRGSTWTSQAATVAEAGQDWGCAPSRPRASLWFQLRLGPFSSRIRLSLSQRTQKMSWWKMKRKQRMQSLQWQCAYGRAQKSFSWKHTTALGRMVSWLQTWRQALARQWWQLAGWVSDTLGLLTIGCMWTTWKKLSLNNF